MSNSLRDQILAADDIATEPVEIPEWNCTLHVKSMTGKARAQMLKQAADPETGEMDYERLYPQVIVATCVDPETGEYVFTNDDTEALNQKSGSVLERLATAGMKISGMTGASENDLGKGSSSESDGSTSS